MKTTPLKTVTLWAGRGMLTGCGGGDSSVQASTITAGQESSALKKACGDGIITGKKHASPEKRVLKRYDGPAMGQGPGREGATTCDRGRPIR